MTPPRHISRIKLEFDKDFGLERLIWSRNAYEERHEDPSKDYGVAGVTLGFVVIGSEGAVEWELLTNSYLPATEEAYKERKISFLGPTAGPVWWHWRTPRWENHDDRGQCEWLQADHCFSDIGFSIGDEVNKAFTNYGYDGVFNKLKVLYEYAKEPEA